MSRHDSSLFASSARATIAAAIGAEAEVPVCLVSVDRNYQKKMQSTYRAVQILRRSVVTICFSAPVPDEYVDANVEAHASEYHGMDSVSDVELIEIV